MGKALRVKFKLVRLSFRLQKGGEKILSFLKVFEVELAEVRVGQILLIINEILQLRVIVL
jgi:hypothetical protein